MNNNFQKQEKKSKKINNNIGFYSLYEAFKVKFILKFLLTTIVVVLSWYLLSVNSRTFSEERSDGAHFHDCSEHSHANFSIKKNSHNKNISSLSSVNDEEYNNYLPFWNYWKKFYPFSVVSKEQFIAITLSFLLLYSLFSYLSSSVENEIIAESYFYLKDILLKKFWKISIEQKKKKKDELRILLENEVETISKLWEHLPLHFFESVFTILIFSAEKFVELKNTNRGLLTFFFALNIGFITIYNWVSNYSTKKYKLYREVENEELIIINKQISNAQLIENMGLTTFYEKLRNESAKKTLFTERIFDRSASLLGSVNYYFPQFYRYLSLLFISGSFSLKKTIKTVVPFFIIFDSLKNILDCFKSYSKYKFACLRFNNFLNTEEREENLEKASILNLEVEEIIFTDVDFKYESSEQLVLKSLSRKFSKGTLNRIIGANGSGKTTILYLILGVVKPLKGEVIIKFSGGKTINLHKEINLREWREKIVAYFSHDNLIENGSTGQRQLENISKNLDQRNNSQVFIFDESINALDSEKQQLVIEKITKIIDEGKIVIFVQHETNLTSNSNSQKKKDV